MEVERESVGLAIAFTAGIAAVTFSLNWFYKHPALMQTGSATAIAATLSLAVCLAVKSRENSRNFLNSSFWKSRAAIGLLFLLAGCTVCLVAAIPFVRQAETETGFIRNCGERFAGLIDSIPYRDRMSNAIVKAFLAGDRSGIPREVRDSFRAAGASHLLALSGMHLGIIYLVFSKLLSVLGNSPVAVNVRSAAIITGSGFFTLMTGAAPSLVRAFLFILLREVAAILRRRTDNINIFCVSLMLQLAISPDEVTSVGFQLSYLAMLGIFLLFPWLDGLWDKALALYGPSAGGSEKASAGRWLGAAMRKIWSLSVLSISCQVFTAPAVLLYFGTFPRYFLITNLVCAPLSSIIMTVSMMVIPLHALGVCPGFLLSLTDFLVHTLVWSLEIISSL